MADSRTAVRTRTPRLRRISVPDGPLVWQCTGEPERAAFFFLWPGPGRLDPLRDAAIDPNSPHARRIRSALRRLAHARFLAGEGGDRGVDLDDGLLSVRGTALFDRTRRESDPRRYPDPSEVPSLTLSARRTFRPTGVDLGDLATVWNPANGLFAHAVVADARDVPGAEPSPYLCEALGLRPGEPAVYLVHPGSGRGQGAIPSNDEIARRGEDLFRRAPAGWPDSWGSVLSSFFERIAART